MKKVLAAFCAFVIGFFGTGCNTASKLYSYTQENPLIVDLATRQAVFRYIDAGSTTEQKKNRALRVKRVVERVEHFLEGNPTASRHTLFLVVKSNVDLKSLDPADRVLVEDILTVIELNIERATEEAVLDKPIIIQVRVLLRTLLKTAALFYDPA